MIKIITIIIGLFICFQLQAQQFGIIYNQPELIQIDSLEKKFAGTKGSNIYHLMAFFIKDKSLAKFDTGFLYTRYETNDSSYHINYYYKKNEEKINTIVFAFYYDSVFISKAKKTYELIKKDIFKNLYVDAFREDKTSTKITRDIRNRKRRIKTFIMLTEWKKENLHAELKFYKTLKNNSEIFGSGCVTMLTIWWNN